MLKLCRFSKHPLWLFSIVFMTACDSGHKVTHATLDKRASPEQLSAMNQTTKAANDYYFGFDLRSSPQEDARQYLPFLEYLKKSTGYNFKLRFTPKDGKIVDDLGRGVVQFAAIGATSYVQAAIQYKVIPLVRGVNSQGKAEYRSMMIVRKNSPIHNLRDIRGKRFAFGSVTSTQGHLIPRIILSQQGIKLSDFSRYEYTGSHQKCADAVISGRFDVCGLQDTMAKNLANKQPVRILHASAYFPSSGIAANKDVAREVVDKVRQALLNFRPKGRDAKGLYHWDKTEMANGFVAATDNDYSALRKWLYKLGFIDSTQDLPKGDL